MVLPLQSGTEILSLFLTDDIETFFYKRKEEGKKQTNEQRDKERMFMLTVMSKDNLWWVLLTPEHASSVTKTKHTVERNSEINKQKNRKTHIRKPGKQTNNQTDQSTIRQ